MERDKKQNQFYEGRAFVHAGGMPSPTVPLEDELGDVLEKAMHGAGLTFAEVAAAANIPAARIRDAIDYRSELGADELQRLAGLLGLNEVGLCALAGGCYPLPECPGLPFSLRALHMPHGVGVANAYLVSAGNSGAGILFDTGPTLNALLAGWPAGIRRVDAVFLTHVEGEHTGGLCDVVDYFGIPAAYVPAGCRSPCGRPMTEPQTVAWENLEVTAYSTPGHAAAHNCYRIRVKSAATAMSEVLIAGDLIFAGSAGGAYFCCAQHQRHLHRILQICPPQTVIAPGHGPLTTVAHERRYNPFVP
jgi:glyoxylase-like metal-dependent hydrolase (beta-lactamase superfamily II)